jgi:hypothetical protein
VRILTYQPDNRLTVSARTRNIKKPRKITHEYLHFTQRYRRSTDKRLYSFQPATQKCISQRCKFQAAAARTYLELTRLNLRPRTPRSASVSSTTGLAQQRGGRGRERKDLEDIRAMNEIISRVPYGRRTFLQYSSCSSISRQKGSTVTRTFKQRQCHWSTDLNLRA